MFASLKLCTCLSQDLNLRQNLGKFTRPFCLENRIEKTAR
jgi:hypothetical protein